MKPQLVFIHGWGFDASIWRGIVSHLPGVNTSTIELGFIGGPVEEPLQIPDKAIIIGHSLGVMWALKHLPHNPAALISICGFERFSPPVPRKSLDIMKRGLKRNPMAQMSHFWRSCGIAPFASVQQLNEEALLEGLTGLMDWDTRLERTNLSCPVHALAAGDDEIVSPEMSEAIWGAEHIIWADEGGHALPLTQPHWCADQIRHIIERNE